MIDDALFAQMWVTSRHRGRGLAGRALSQELRRKGVDDDDIAEAVATLDPEQEAATARALVDRKLRATRRSADATPACAGSPGCSPARATRPGSPSASCKQALAAEGEEAELAFDAAAGARRRAVTGRCAPASSDGWSMASQARTVHPDRPTTQAEVATVRWAFWRARAQRAAGAAAVGGGHGRCRTTSGCRRGPRPRGRRSARDERRRRATAATDAAGAPARPVLRGEPGRRRARAPDASGPRCARRSAARGRRAQLARTGPVVAQLRPCGRRPTRPRRPGSARVGGRPDRHARGCCRRGRRPGRTRCRR